MSIHPQAKSFFKSLSYGILTEKCIGLKSLLLVILVANSPAMAYTLYDLGPNVEPKDINNNGLVVGSSNTDQYPATAFSWTLVGGFELIDGGISANAVNDNGQIAGTTIDGAFILDGNYRDWSDYGAFGINQAGDVAGYQVGTNPYQPRSLPYNPAIYDGSKWTVFDIAKLYPRGTRQGVYADRFILNSMNDGGYAVGYKYRYGLAGSSVILIDTNGPVNDASDVDYLPVPNGGSASAVNNQNHIVGTTGSNSSAGEYSFAFLYDYDGNALINLGTLPVNETEFGLTSYANDINDMNQVVGSSRLITALTSINDPTKYHAFIWEPGADGSLEGGTMTDLNHLVQLPKGWLLTHATAINENGDIVGLGLLDGIEHGFLIKNGTITEPPPEPNQPPVAVASADVYTGKAPLVVNFNSSGSIDPDGIIAEVTWDFNDGSSSTLENPSHEFSIPGTYLVTLTVTDNQGAESSSSITIKVRKGKRK